MNLELNVVRFENEDVIATSGEVCDVNLQTGSIMHVITSITGNDVSRKVYQYNADNKQFEFGISNSDNINFYLTKGCKQEDVAVGNLLHRVGNKYEVCKDPTAHTLKENN